MLILEAYPNYQRAAIYHLRTIYNIISISWDTVRDVLCCIGRRDEQSHMSGSVGGWPSVDEGRIYDTPFNRT